MRLWRAFTRAAVVSASLGVAMPQSTLLAAGPTAQAQSLPAAAPAIEDVQLHEGGTLYGQVVDAQGAPLAGRAVTLEQQDRQLAAATTNKQGQFAIKGLSGGVYQLNAEGAASTYRAWAYRTAPPAAKPGATIVTGVPLVRGQCHPSLVGFLSNPWVIAGIIGAAIAVPIALNNHDDDESGS